MEIRYDFDPGQRTFGYEGMYVESGTFSNDEFGSYKYAGHMSVGTHIMVHTDYGLVLVFNLGSDSDTERFRQSLMNRLD